MLVSGHGDAAEFFAVTAPFLAVTPVALPLACCAAVAALRFLDGCVALLDTCAACELPVVLAGVASLEPFCDGTPLLSSPRDLRVLVIPRLASPELAAWDACLDAFLASPWFLLWS